MDTYSTPEHDVQTKDPIVMLTYVTPRWPQSKQHRLLPEDTISRKVFSILSLSCFGLSILAAQLLLSSNRCELYSCLFRVQNTGVSHFFEQKTTFTSKRAALYLCTDFADQFFSCSFFVYGLISFSANFHLFNQIE